MGSPLIIFSPSGCRGQLVIGSYLSGGKWSCHVTGVCLESLHHPKFWKQVWRSRGTLKQVWNSWGQPLSSLKFFKKSRIGIGAWRACFPLTLRMFILGSLTPRKMGWSGKGRGSEGLFKAPKVLRNRERSDQQGGTRTCEGLIGQLEGWDHAHMIIVVLGWLPTLRVPHEFAQEVP